ncbi:MAG: hypothetical protein ACLPZR_05000 [Solirubrobacteraceae bacterium]
MLGLAWSRRVTLVVADGGYGKTTALRALGGPGPVCRVELGRADCDVEVLARRLVGMLGASAVERLSAPAAAIGAEDRHTLAEAHAALLCEHVAKREDELLLVIDDVDQLGDRDTAVTLLQALCLRAPPQLHIGLSGKRVPHLGLGSGGMTGGLPEIAAPDLAFTPEETGAPVHARLGSPHDALAHRCWELTGGSPAALALLVDRLDRVARVDRERVLDRLRGPSGRLWREFVLDLLERESPEAQLALSIALVIPVLDPALLAAFGVDRAGDAIEGMLLRGLLVAAGDDRGATISPALAEIVAGRLTAAEADALRDRAATWLESAGRIEDALECRRRGPAETSRKLMERHGHSLVAQGYGALVAEVLSSVGTGEITSLDAILGEAFQSIGDWDRAISQFRRVQL